jgi:quinol monooxygenase YgiN
MYIEVCSYRVKPGRREEFLEHFAAKGIPAIRAHGIRVLGPLPDLENPNRFVWLRSFASREERDRLNGAFHRSAAWVNEIAPIAMPMLQSWDFAVCETYPGYTQDELGG